MLFVQILSGESLLFERRHTPAPTLQCNTRHGVVATFLSHTVHEGLNFHSHSEGTFIKEYLHRKPHTVCQCQPDTFPNGKCTVGMHFMASQVQGQSLVLVC